MYRFVLYMGSLIMLDLLKGDGFGLAWYVPDISPEPA